MNMVILYDKPMHYGLKTIRVKDGSFLCYHRMYMSEDKDKFPRSDSFNFFKNSLYSELLENTYSLIFPQFPKNNIAPAQNSLKSDSETSSERL